MAVPGMEKTLQQLNIIQHGKMGSKRIPAFWRKEENMKAKKFLSVLLVLIMAFSFLSGCGTSNEDTADKTETSTQETTSGETTEEAEDTAEESTEETKADDGKTYKIGVLQLTEHAALDASNKGFVAALDDSGISYEIDQQNAQNDQSACQTIAAKLVADGDDLILAIATPAAQAAAAETEDIPIIVTAVTDPADSGLVASNDAPGGNVTGTSDLTPVKEQIELLTKLLPDAKKVGILYCTAEANSVIQADMAAAACKDSGLESEVYTVSSSNEIQQVVESMVGNVDVIYAPTDNTIAAGMTTVSMVATENKLPIICGESGMVDNGGLATYGIDYYQLGYMAGEQAVKILKGEAAAAETPIGYLSADKCELTVNQEIADQLGIDTSVVQ